MLRTLAAFVAIFALLSWIVGLFGPLAFFASLVLVLLGIDLAVQQLPARPRPAKVRRESLVI